MNLWEYWPFLSEKWNPDLSLNDYELKFKPHTFSPIALFGFVKLICYIGYVC
jgi:hypothetical protein